MNPKSPALKTKAIAPLLWLPIAALLASSLTSPAQSTSEGSTENTAQLLNLSSRMLVQTGEHVGIAGFIITGTALKHVLLRAMGPSLAKIGIPTVLHNPALELRDDNGTLIAANNNWRDTQQTAIQATGMPPGNDLESAIDKTLDPGRYTAIVNSEDGSSGLAVLEIYDLDPSVDSKLANISTRAVTTPGDNTLIAGFILGGTGTDEIVVRGIGPSLTKQAVPDPLMDPVLQLHDGNGTLIATNNDLVSGSPQEAEISNAGLLPSDPHEAAIAGILRPGHYTALLAGENETSGVGVVEIYDLGSKSKAASVTRIQTGTVSNIEAQHVDLTDVKIADTFRLVFTQPTTINHSAIGSRAALQGITDNIKTDASAADIQAAIRRLKGYYAYGQFGNREGANVSLDFFSNLGALNREPIVNGNATKGFTIYFGSTVGTTTVYNTWVTNLPLVSILVP